MQQIFNPGVIVMHPQTDFKVESTKLEVLEELLQETLDLPEEATASVAAESEIEALESEPAPEPIPLEAAAFLLGLPASEVKEQIREGTRRGFKTKSKKGKRWFVDRAELEGLSTQLTTQNSTVCLLEEVSSDVCEQASPADQLEKQLDWIRELHSKVESLTYRNGYLEGQLAEKDEQLKLITDSQQKPVNEPQPGGLGKLWSWLFRTR
jgi:hypothetical protein